MSANRESIYREKCKKREEICQKAKKRDKQKLLKEKEAIEEKLESLASYKKARTILFFWSLPGEVDTQYLIERAMKRGKKVALPVVINDRDMKIYQYTGDNCLVKNKWGICEPNREKAFEIKVDDLDMVIVPAIAFDRKNRRLGRGKGYYDRFLKKLSSKTKKVGIAYCHQMVDAVPCDPLQDEEVDIVISA